MYIDAHCHLGPEGLPIADVLRSTQHLYLVNATTLEDAGRIAELAEPHPALIAFVGIHPRCVSGLPPDWVARLEALLAVKGRGLGEVGLDRIHATKGDGEEALRLQRAVLASQLGLACRHEVPVSLHTVRAWPEMLESLREHGLPRPECPVLAHDFQGTYERARALLDLGLFLSLSLRHAGQRELFTRLPLERLFLESDGPVAEAAIEETYRLAASLLGKPIELLEERLCTHAAVFANRTLHR